MSEGFQISSQGLQFIHITKGDNAPLGTITVVLPPKSILEACGSSNRTIEASVGLTVKSTRDRFVKRVGRDLASKNISPISLSIQQIEFYGDKTVYRFGGLKSYGTKEIRNKYLELTFSTYKYSDKVRLIEGKIC